jgi:hypothetical protein
MTRSSLFLLLFSGWLCTTCSKSTPFTIDVSAITATDALGVPNGSADPSDWAFDATWSETETSLFRTDPVDMSGTSVATVTLQPAYPNPTTGRQVTLQFTCSAVTFMRIAVVDAQLNKKAFYQFKTDPGLNAFIIPFSEMNYPANKNYRIYYSFDTPAQPMYLKGHGDIQLNN